MSVRFVPWTFIESQRSGLAKPAGQLFIFIVSRCGQRTLELLLNSGKLKDKISILHCTGDVLGAICPKKTCHRLICAGVRKRWSQDPMAGCPLILVVRPVESLESSPNPAHTHAISYATLVLVLPAHTWAPLKAASVASIKPRKSVPRQTTTSAHGAVVASVEI